MESSDVDGIKLVCSFSTVSNCACLVMLFCIVYRTHAHQVISRLLLNLAISDFIQSIGFMMSYRWLAINTIEPGTYCTAQSILINIGDVASGFWAMVICIHSYFLVVHSYEHKYLVPVAMIMIWPLNILIAFSGLLISKPEKPFFNKAASWCWISEEYSIYRIAFHYGPILFIAMAMLFIYIMMFAVLYKKQVALRKVNRSNKVLQNVAKKLIWYPFVYMVLVLPLGLQRLASIGGKKLPPQYLVVAACIFTSAGFVNAAIYGITRNIISVKPVFEIIPTIKRRATLNEGASRSTLDIPVHTTIITVITTTTTVESSRTSTLINSDGLAPSEENAAVKANQEQDVEELVDVELETPD